MSIERRVQCRDRLLVRRGLLSLRLLHFHRARGQLRVLAEHRLILFDQELEVVLRVGECHFAGGLRMLPAGARVLYAREQLLL